MRVFLQFCLGTGEQIGEYPEAFIGRQLLPDKRVKGLFFQGPQFLPELLWVAVRVTLQEGRKAREIRIRLQKKWFEKEVEFDFKDVELPPRS